MNNRPLTVSETARLLGISAETVRKYADNGTLPVSRTPGGHRIFAERDITRIANERRRREQANGD